MYVSNMKNLMLILAIICFSSGLRAEIQIFDFTDEQLEKRFKHLTSILRCPKCQNQNLTGSNSTLSQDLKQIVYEKLHAGESDKNILAFMRQRYGEFILFKPELSQSNLFLWAGPLIFLLLMFFGFVYWYKNNRVVNSENLSQKLRESNDD